MALGYRYLKGVGVPVNCALAVQYLELAANDAVRLIEERGFPLFSDRSRLQTLHEDGRKDGDTEVRTYVTFAKITH